MMAVAEWWTITMAWLLYEDKEKWHDILGDLNGNATQARWSSVGSVGYIYMYEGGPPLIRGTLCLKGIRRGKDLQATDYACNSAVSSIMYLLSIGAALVGLDQVFVVELSPAEDVTPVTQIIRAVWKTIPGKKVDRQ